MYQTTEITVKIATIFVLVKTSGASHVKLTARTIGHVVNVY